MAPPIDVHVEVPEPYEYKPKKIDDAPTRMRLDRNGDKPVTIVRIWNAPR